MLPRPPGFVRRRGWSVLPRVLFLSLLPSALAGAASVTSVHATWIAVQWKGTSATAELAAGWLRERSLKAGAVQPETNQPVVGFHEGARDGAAAIEIAQARFTKGGATLRVEFGDGHIASFASQRLADELDGERRFQQLRDDEHALLPQRTWDKSLLLPPQFEHAELAASDDAKLDLLTQLLRTGLAIVKGTPAVDGEVVRFGESISTVRRTDWGALFNVRARPDDGVAGDAGVVAAECAAAGEASSCAAAAVNASAAAASASASASTAKADLAYTAAPLSFHTDNPYRSPPPDFQVSFLSCTVTFYANLAHNLTRSP